MKMLLYILLLNVFRITFSFGVVEAPSVSLYEFSKLIKDASNCEEVFNKPGGWDKIFISFGTEYVKQIYDFYNKKVEKKVEFFGGQNLNFKDNNFISKVCLSDEARAFVIGDLHSHVGGLKSIIKTLQSDDYKAIDKNSILRKNTYLFFLGDYIDRGHENLKLLSFLILLGFKNLGKIFFIRGNHEANIINENQEEIRYFELYGRNYGRRGLYTEITEVYNHAYNSKMYKNIKYGFGKFVNVMPVATFIGKKRKNGEMNFKLLSHAAIDPRLDYRKFLEIEFMDSKKIQFCAIDNNNLFIAENFIKWLYSFDYSLTNLVLDYNFLNHVIGVASGSPALFLWPDVEVYDKRECDLYYGNSVGRLKFSSAFVATFLKQYASDYKGEFKTTGFVHGHNHILPLSEKQVDFGYFDDKYNSFNVSTIISGGFNIISGIKYKPSCLLIDDFDKGPKLVKCT